MIPAARISSIQSNLSLPPSDLLEGISRHIPSTVLLAEDDDDLRCVMSCVLASMGYLVVACADAQRASSAFHLHPRIDALVTDFEMPGRTGLELARELTAVSPMLPVAIVTGSILSTDVTNEIRQREWVHLSKPCVLSSLQAALIQGIDRRLKAA